ncbi:MAG TPA: hypothetical protein VGD14_12905 [bacterium]
MKYYNILCWQRAFPYFPSDIKELVTSHLYSAVHQLSLNPEEMNICWLVPTRHSIIAQKFFGKVSELLEREIARQSYDGGWWPTWEWGQYPEACTIARKEWAGKITLDILLALRQHERITHDGTFTATLKPL